VFSDLLNVVFELDGKTVTVEYTVTTDLKEQLQAKAVVKKDGGKLDVLDTALGKKGTALACAAEATLLTADKSLTAEDVLNLIGGTSIDLDLDTGKSATDTKLSSDRVSIDSNGIWNVVRLTVTLKAPEDLAAMDTAFVLTLSEVSPSTTASKATYSVVKAGDAVYAKQLTEVGGADAAAKYVETTPADEIPSPLTFDSMNSLIGSETPRTAAGKQWVFIPSTTTLDFAALHTSGLAAELQDKPSTVDRKD